MNFVCFQLGAREHYAVPRALFRGGALAALMTDVWSPPAWWTAKLLPPGLRERFHSDLAAAPVRSFNAGALAFETTARLQGAKGWALIMARNRWFQNEAAREMGKVEAVGPTVFAYSYAARGLLRAAKERGWRTILGQVDPAIEEERIVSGLAARYRDLGPDWTPAPAAYWDGWREECAFADCIVVNSTWSKQAIEQAGVPAEKINVIPPAYEPPDGAGRFDRAYPERFTSERPLRVLFLGQLVLRKGMAEVFETIRLVRGEPVEFRFVGRPGVVIPGDIRWNSSVRWFGAVPRGQAARFYREADLFLFPTHSDGFGLTQLEAQAWKLPILASRSCGEVVRHDENGRLLEEVSGPCLAAAIQWTLRNPEALARWSERSSLAERFGLGSLKRELMKLGKG